jgi:hypothetical protein
MYINSYNRLSGDIDLGKEIDFSEIIKDKLPKDNIITIPDKKTDKIPIQQDEILEPLSDCNKTTWKYGVGATCLVLYFGLPLLFGNK